MNWIVDQWLVYYNTERPYQGYRNLRRTCQLDRDKQQKKGFTEEQIVYPLR